MHTYPFPRKSVALCFAVLWLTLGTDLAQGAELKLKRKFVEDYKDTITTEIDFFVDDVGKVHSAKADGDLHFSGRSKDIGLPIVGEIMNAKFHKKPIGLLKKALNDPKKAIKLTGVPRLWWEHAGGEDQVQFDPLEPFDDANPDHMFEIHPVTKVEGESVLDSLKPVPGYTAPGDKNRPKRAFKAFAKKKFSIKEGKDTVTLKTTNLGFNYIEFHMTLRKRLAHVKGSGGRVVIADAVDLEEEIAARNVRMLFVEGSAPYDDMLTLKPGQTLHVLGTPRVSLFLVHERLKKGGEALNLPLPYEIIVVGVYGEEDRPSRR